MFRLASSIKLHWIFKCDPLFFVLLPSSEHKAYHPDKMALKRTADDAAIDEPRLRRELSKRTRLSPSADAGSNSSDPSSCSVSLDSALQSSPPASTRDRISSMSSLQSRDSESGSGCSISSSSDSESESSESDEGNDIVTIGGPKKPSIQRLNIADRHEDLRSRITAFLPQLEEANSLLASEGGNHSIEDVEDGEQHIEMNLGLGVLEEQDDDGGSSDSGSEESADDEEELELPISSEVVKESPRGNETRRLDKLRGQHGTAAQAAGIAEIE